MPRRAARAEGRFRTPHMTHAAPLTVAAVAARLGVAASTLRTWDRRYGLGPSSHEAGSHRRYTPADVARLERMRELTLQGVAPADAAEIATRGEEDAATGDGGAQAPAQPAERLLVDPLSLAAAAVEPDPARTARMVEQAVREDGIVETWLELAQPALEMIAHRGRTDRPGSDPEIVLADAVLSAVREVAAAGRQRHGGRATAGSVLLMGSAEGRMRAHVIAAGLMERAIGARVLRVGGDVLEQTRQAITERGANVLALIGDPEGAEEIVQGVTEDGGVQVFLVGADAPDLWLPGLHRVRTVRAAVDEIAASMSD